MAKQSNVDASTIRDRLDNAYNYYHHEKSAPFIASSVTFVPLLEDYFGAPPPSDITLPLRLIERLKERFKDDLVIVLCVCVCVCVFFLKKKH
jgi:hypothetical protein